MKSDWLLDKPRLNYWLRFAVCILASQPPCLAGVTQSHCDPQTMRSIWESNLGYQWRQLSGWRLLCRHMFVAVLIYRPVL